MNKTREFNLEERLVGYALRVMRIVEDLPDTRVCNHLGSQLLRSGTSPALNYGEAQAAESSKDFVHKLMVILKELRESSITLKLLARHGFLPDDMIMKESGELVAIFTASVRTAKRSLSQAS